MQTVGYYSVIQYCPNQLTMEVVNVGLVLFVPKLQFLGVRISENNNRARKFFGKDSFDNEWLSAAKTAIKNRLEMLKDSVKELSEFKKFIDTRVNEILLTQLKAVKVENAEATLDGLFHELVPRVYEQPKSRHYTIQELDAAFRSPELVGRIEFKIPVRIPALGRSIQVPYVYKNGTYNIVKTELFTEDKKPIEKGSLLATEGRFIAKAPVNLTLAKPTLTDLVSAKLIIVPEVQCSKDEKSQKLISALSNIFDDAGIRTIWPEMRTDFIKEVKEQAHTYMPSENRFPK